MLNPTGYVAPIPEEERGDMITAYYKYLTGDDVAKKHACALAWSKWEMSTSKLEVDPKYLARADNPEWALAFARIEVRFSHFGNIHTGIMWGHLGGRDSVRCRNRKASVDLTLVGSAVLN